MYFPCPLYEASDSSNRVHVYEEEQVRVTMGVKVLGSSGLVITPNCMLYEEEVVCSQNDTDKFWIVSANIGSTSKE